MKAKILLIGLLTTLFSCSGQKQIVEEDKTGKKVEAVNKDNTKDVSGLELNIHLEKHIKYCGGAAPGPDQLNNYEPFSKETFYLTRDKESVSFTTDAKGNATVKLEKGIYCLKTSRRHNKSKTKAMLGEKEWNFDTDCLEDWFSGCDYDIELLGDTSIEITLRTRCGYDGPVPCITNLPAPPP